MAKHYRAEVDEKEQRRGLLQTSSISTSIIRLLMWGLWPRACVCRSRIGLESHHAKEMIAIYAPNYGPCLTNAYYYIPIAKTGIT